MLEDLAVQTAHTVTRAVEIIGVAIIALGALGTLAIFTVRIARRDDYEAAVGDFRSSMGRAILLGLEFLVAADIISTVAIEPTLQSVAVLAAIVAVRTFLSFSLEVEIEGRWPWQRSGGKQKHE